MKHFIEDIRKRVMIYDGSKGYLLQKLGLKGGECPELWNVEHSDRVKSVYYSYRDAGSDVIQTNTFQGNRLVLKEYGLEDRVYELNYKGTQMAKEVMGEAGYVAASVGPLGKLFEPSGELTFQMAYDAFREQVVALADGGADIINFETFTDLAELRAALLAAKESTNLPVICSLAFEENQRTLMGTDPFTAAVVLNSLGADMVGTNCSFGPEHQIEIIRKMMPSGAILCAKPNAGLPEVIDGVTAYKETPERFAGFTSEFLKEGVRLIGGCCGTTPEFIKSLRASVTASDCCSDNLTIIAAKNDMTGLIASNTKVLSIIELKDNETAHLNANTDIELYKALLAGDFELVTEQSLDIAAEGCRAVRINVDKAAADDKLLADVVNIAQGYIREPFILQSEKPEMLEAAIRLYKGRAGLAVTGNEASDAVIRSLADKYGCVII